MRVAGPVAAALLLSGVFGIGQGLGQLTGALPFPRPGHASAPPGTASALAPSRPVRVSIPAIGVRAPVHPVGLADDGTIAVPAPHRNHEAGWYDRGPAPGQHGPAIIVGHVDGTRGPAVFHRLASLRPGDLVEVARRDRRVALFRVDTVERYDKEHLPAGKVYGDFSRAGLRLITCGGRWVGGTTGYAQNVIVFASLVRTRKA